MREDYSDVYFCGKETTKYSATASEGAGSSVSEDRGWFINNVAWIAPTFTILATAIGLLLKYDEIKKLLQRAPCFRKGRDEETCSGVEQDAFGDRLLYVKTV